MFRANRLPQLARPAVEDQLTRSAPSLRLAREAARLGRGHERLEGLRARAATGNPLERERVGAELATLVGDSRSGRVSQAAAEALAAAERVAKQHADRVPQAERQLAALHEQIAQLGRLLAPTSAAGPPGTSMESAMLAMLRSRLEQEIARGRVTPERAAELRDVVARAEAAFASDGDELVTLQKRTQALREVMRLTADFAAEPSWHAKDPAPGTRAGRAVAILKGLRRSMLAEKLVGMLPAGESEAGSDLLTRVATLEARIREAAGDERRVAAIDGDVWRLAADVHAYVCRYNLLLAQPVFQTRRELGSPRSVFVSGGDALRVAADLLQARGEIVIHGEAPPGDYAQQRWNQLWSATVAVFDVGVPGGPARAQVCYELGLALAVGRPCVITVKDGQALPFDVEPTPHVLRERADADSACCPDAIGGALAVPAWGGVEAGLGDRPARALAWLEQRTGERLAGGAEGIALRLTRAERGDAVGFRRALDQLLGMLGADAPLALLPVWPASYPDPTRQRQCFHVMPFGLEWSNPTRELARATCAARGWSYRRGRGGGTADRPGDLDGDRDRLGGPGRHHGLQSQRRARAGPRARARPADPDRGARRLGAVSIPEHWQGAGPPLTRPESATRDSRPASSACSIQRPYDCGRRLVTSGPGGE